ncbi:MAG: hypothetical protein ACTTJ6_03915 [Treponema sp.]
MDNKDVSKIKQTVNKNNSSKKNTCESGCNKIKSNVNIEDNIKMQEQLFSILVDENLDFTKWMENFNEYAVKYPRFLYSCISNYILDEKDDSNIGRLLANIDEIKEKILNETTQSLDKKYLMILKLYDHCHLANKQREAYKATREAIEKRIEKIAKKEIKEYEKNITSQLIGLIAIFTALSFLLVGGISSFGNIFQILNTASLLRIFILSDVWLLCMFNLFTLFIKTIAIVTDRTFEITNYVKEINIFLCCILGILIALYCCGNICKHIGNIYFI